MLSDPVMMAEHMALENLVKPEDVTAVAVRTGTWSDPGTWQGGVLPGAGANVLIPEGMSVTVDGVFSAALHTIRADGTLRFDPDHNTGLTVDTLVVTCDGTLEMGTQARPISAGVTAQITIAGQGPIDTNWDPRELSRGVLVEGSASIHGAAVTPFVDVYQTPRAGDTSIVLAQVPVGWRPGDQVVLPGTSPYQTQDEVLTIQAISGNKVQVSPLLYDHATPSPDLRIQLGDLTRNVVIRSADPTLGMRGHVMFMHTDEVDVDDAEFLQLGRTDKSQPLNNPVLDSNGHLVPGTGLNPTGRYAVHVHRAGVDASMPPALIRDSVVWGSPGWGFVNHSSYVNYSNNLAYDVLGAAYVSEAGDEIGSFDHNLAVHSKGSGVGFDRRGIDSDMAHQGIGFWLQGGGVRVTNNIAAGQAGDGFFFWQSGLTESDRGVRTFDAANLTNPAWANGQSTVSVDQVPILEFRNNVAYASTVGAEFWNFHLFPTNTARDNVDNLTVWGANMDYDHGHGVRLFYTGDYLFRNLRVIGDSANPTGIALSQNQQSHDVSYINPDIEGWSVGIVAPSQGPSSIAGGTISAVQGVYVDPSPSPATGRTRSVNIDSSVQFPGLPSSVLRGATQYSIYLNTPSFDFTAVDFSPLFAQRFVVTVGGRALYLPQQAPNFVPFRPGQAPANLPAALLDKTNQQLWDYFGLSVLGAVAPSDAAAAPGVNALSSATSTYVSPVDIYSATFTSQLTGYLLQYTGATPSVVTDPTPINLAEGWNLIPRVVDGVKRTFLVFGDDRPPVFTLAPDETLTIRESQVNNHWIHIAGTLTDDSFAPITDGLWIWPDTHPILTRADGSRYIALSVWIGDRAGNITTLKFELTVVSG
jgi:hypothetical protein